MFFTYPSDWKQIDSPHGYGPMYMLWGERVFAAIITIPANEPVQEPHIHANEQVGILLEGEVTMGVGGETRKLKKGDAYLAPSNVPHGRALVSPTEIKMLEIFSSPREDLIKRLKK